MRSLQEWAADLAALRAAQAADADRIDRHGAGLARTSAGRERADDDGSGQGRGDPGHRRGARPAPGRRVPRAHPHCAPASPSSPGPGTSWRSRSGGPESSMLLRRAFSIYSVQSRGVYGGTLEIVFATHGKGTEWLVAAAPARPGRHRRPARPAVRAAEGAGVLRARRPAATAPRRCSPSPTRCGRAAAASTSCSAPPPRASCSASSTPSASRRRSPSRPRTARWASTAGSPTSCPAVLARTDADVVYACGPMAHAAAVSEVAARARRLLPVRGRGVDGLRHRRLHDLRAAGHRRRRRHAHAALLRRRSGVPRRPGALGRGRHDSRATRSVRP